MKLTILRRLKICWEVLTYTSGHDHPAQEKGLSIFQRGYSAGFYDAVPKLRPMSGTVDLNTKA